MYRIFATLLFHPILIGRGEKSTAASGAVHDGSQSRLNCYFQRSVYSLEQESMGCLSSVSDNTHHQEMPWLQTCSTLCRNANVTVLLLLAPSMSPSDWPPCERAIGQTTFLRLLLDFCMHSLINIVALHIDIYGLSSLLELDLSVVP